MTSLLHTPTHDLPIIRDTLKQSFRSGITRPLAWRRHQLRQLARLLQENSTLFEDALLKDLGKPRQESLYAEIGATIERTLLSAERLEGWAKPDVPDLVPEWQKPWNPTVFKVPKGTVLILAPWNYPLILSLQPFIGAIAAGCTAIVKPSELAPAYAQLLAELFPKYMDNSAFKVVNGGVPETTKLLELQWDHIFYTGNSRVARIIAAAAAKHLTPTTLELGGKSPIIIDPAYEDIELAAKRIMWGKTNNAGQLCVSPDYVLVPRSKQDQLTAALKASCQSFFPEGALQSASYGNIINAGHHARLTSMLSRTKGKVAFGGGVIGTTRFEPTVVQDVPGDDSVMEEEIFGPILPLVPFDSIDEAIEFVNARPHPLTLYTFTDDAVVKQKVFDETASGSIVFNDTFIQLAVHDIPLAGTGESGHGMQVLKYTYDTFTHQRASIDVPRQVEPFLQMRYPPYDESSEYFQMMTGSARLKIPDSD